MALEQEVVQLVSTIVDAELEQEKPLFDEFREGLASELANVDVSSSADSAEHGARSPWIGEVTAGLKFVAAAWATYKVGKELAKLGERQPNDREELIRKWADELQDRGFSEEHANSIARRFADDFTALVKRQVTGGSK